MPTTFAEAPYTCPESPPEAVGFPRVSPQLDTANYHSETTYTTPLRIGDSAVIHSRVMLAPMAGVTDVIFRSLVRQSAPHSLICTEMISSNGLVYSKRWDAQILDKSLEDHPIAYQLAANRQEVLVEAAQNIVAKHRPDTLDLNMGCPVKAVAEAVDVPVTVKCRLGWDFNHLNYMEFGKRMEDAGAKMLTLHTRTRSQGYKPGVQWDALGHLKQAVGIPVIGNGDIVTPQDAKFVLDTYGIDGVMIGRGTQGEPWRIALIDHYLKTNELLPEPTLVERLRYAREHTQKMIDYKGESVAVREMRGQLPWYVKGFKGASQFRGALTQVSTLAEIDVLFEEIQKQVLAISFCP